MRIPLTCSYYGRPLGKILVIIPDSGTGVTGRQAADLAKHLEVELRGLEPLASCMPSKSGNSPARGSMASACADSALKCPEVPASLSVMAVHLAVR